MSGEDNPDPRYHAVASMINSRWAHRVWTLQEQALARQCEAYQGRRSIPISSLQGPQLSVTIGQLTNEEGVTVHTLRHFIHKSCQLYDASPPGLQRQNENIAKALLDGAFELQATQPIDKIYGLYSILTAYCNLPLAAPDYTKTAEEVFEDTVWAYIHTWRDLGVLKLATRPESMRNNLPSWVPAWHKQHPNFARNVRYPQYSHGTHFNWEYSDAEVTSHFGRPLAQSGGTNDRVAVASLLSPGKLCVLGARSVGRVTRTVRPGEYTDIRSLRLEQAIQHLDWCRLLHSISFDSTTGRDEAIHEMFRSVQLPGPRNLEHRKDQEEDIYREEFESFRHWFNFVSHLAETSQLSNSQPPEVNDADHDQATLQLYHDVLAASTTEDAADVLESGYDGDSKGSRESLETFARHISFTITKLTPMGSFSLCLLDNDNMLAVTDFWCQEGDEIFVFPGAENPFVLRRQAHEDSYHLVSPALVDRLFRKGYEKWRLEGSDLQDIILI